MTRSVATSICKLAACALGCMVPGGGAFWPGKRRAESQWHGGAPQYRGLIQATSALGKSVVESFGWVGATAPA